MIQERRQVALENLIYLIIWMILFIAPVVGFKYSSNTTIEWSEVFRSWKMIAPFFLLFLFNNYILVPLLLLRKRTWLYLLSILVLMGIIFLMNPYSVRIMNPNDREHGMLHQGESRPGGLQDGEQQPFQRRDIPPIQRRFSQSDSVHSAGSELRNTEPKPLSRPDMQAERPGFQSGGKRVSDQEGFPPMMRRNPMPHDPFFFFMSPLLKFLMIAILVIGLNLAIKLMFRLIREGQRMKELEKQTLQAELEYLKYQINPHFFMNTLNNIHALIDIDAEKAKDTVLDLSKMMRYVLYDTEQSKLPLEKEIQFLTNYIDLMKLRYTDQVDIRINFPDDIPNVQVPPLLFISFLENAFKHGVSYQHKSYILFSIDVVDNMLECRVENSRSDKIQTQQESGIGLENVRKRLRLLYNEDYTLEIRDSEDKYIVLLIIPVWL